MEEFEWNQICKYMDIDLFKFKFKSTLACNLKTIYLIILIYFIFFRIWTQKLNFKPNGASSYYFFFVKTFLIIGFI